MNRFNISMIFHSLLYSIASAKAYDQYGAISLELEQQTEMREKAEALAIEVMVDRQLSLIYSGTSLLQCGYH